MKPEIRARALSLLKAGALRETEIARALGVSRSAIRRLKRINAGLCARCGRHPATQSIHCGVCARWLKDYKAERTKLTKALSGTTSTAPRRTAPDEAETRRRKVDGTVASGGSR